MKHLPLLVILIPLCGALLCPLLGKLSRNAGKRDSYLRLVCRCSLRGAAARAGGSRRRGAALLARWLETAVRNRGCDRWHQCTDHSAGRGDFLSDGTLQLPV